jgi:hypothetical protein
MDHQFFQVISDYSTTGLAAKMCTLLTPMSILCIIDFYGLDVH